MIVIVCSINWLLLTQVKQDTLRKAIGIVPQDTVLFNTDIKYNIAYGRPSASDEEIINAATAADIHDRIQTFPEGYLSRYITRQAAINNYICVWMLKGCLNSSALGLCLIMSSSMHVSETLVYVIFYSCICAKSLKKLILGKQITNNLELCHIEVRDDYSS